MEAAITVRIQGKLPHFLSSRLADRSCANITNFRYELPRILPTLGMQYSASRTILTHIISTKTAYLHVPSHTASPLA